MMRPNNPDYRNLPNDYQQVDYIGSSGTQYIDTGYTPTVNTEIETELSWGSSQTAWGAFFGVTSNDQWSDGVLGRIYDTSATIFNPWFCNTSYDQCQITTTTDAFHKVILKKNYCTLDGTAGTLTTTGTPYQNNIYLFCGNNGGSAWRHTSVKFRSFKISESGVLVRDFVPCYRKSDDVIGMYDLVNDVFYTNSGTGTFTKGADVPNLIEKQVRPTQTSKEEYYDFKQIGNETDFTNAGWTYRNESNGIFAINSSMGVYSSRDGHISIFKDGLDLSNAKKFTMTATYYVYLGSWVGSGYFQTEDTAHTYAPIYHSIEFNNNSGYNKKTLGNGNRNFEQITYNLPTGEHLFTLEVDLETGAVTLTCDSLYTLTGTLSASEIEDMKTKSNMVNFHTCYNGGYQHQIWNVGWKIE